MSDNDLVKGNEYYNKKNYKNFKNAERREVYNLANNTAKQTIKSFEELKRYLDIQARFPNYSVNNALLISSQMPNAKLLKTESDWNKLGVFKKDYIKYIKILEPYKSGNKSFFKVKKLIDVSQTTSKLSDNKKTYSTEEILKSFLYRINNIKVVDELPSSEGAEFNKDEDILYIVRGSDNNSLLRNLSFAISEMSIDGEYNKDINNFINSCSSYLLCRNVNIDTSSFKIEIPPEIKELETYEIKNILSQARDCMQDNLARINTFFKHLDQKNKEYER